MYILDLGVLMVWSVALQLLIMVISVIEVIMHGKSVVRTYVGHLVCDHVFVVVDSGVGDLLLAGVGRDHKQPLSDTHRK